MTQSDGQQISAGRSPQAANDPPAEERPLGELLSLISHDLRNPLAVARGELELARAHTDNEHLEAVADALERMDAIVDDVLEISASELANQDVESVELDRLVEVCWANVKADDASISIGDLPAVRAEPSRLQQLLENLLWNAVEHGGDDVTITIGALADGFFVEDDGPGIHHDDQEEIFEYGYTTGEDNTGFGLWIVETFADDHGWTVTVTDRDGGGTRFEIRGVQLVNSE